MRKIDIRISICPEFGEAKGYTVTLLREGVEGIIQLASGEYNVEARALENFLSRHVADSLVRFAEDNPELNRVVQRRKDECEIGPLTAENLMAHILSKLGD